MNILSIFAISLISLVTGFSIFLLHRTKTNLNTVIGTIISAVITMMGSLLSGYITGILSDALFLPVGIGTLVGFILGFMAGQPVGILAVLISAVSGVMSGIVGALLGAILQFDNPMIMLGILLGIYVITLGLTILMMIVESNKKLSIDTKGISPYNILSAGLVLVALFLFLYSSDLVKIPGKTDEAQAKGTTANTEIDVTKESAPVIKLTVTPTGYSANVIRVKKGVPVQLEITNPDNSSCYSIFNMPVFNLNNVNLEVGVNKFTITPEEAGQFPFSCGMNMFNGTVIVE